MLHGVNFSLTKAILSPICSPSPAQTHQISALSRSARSLLTGMISRWRLFRQPELIRSTLKNALEHFNRRRIIFFSSSNTLIVIPEEELNAHQNTIAGLAARIEQLFRYYMPLSPAILYQDGIANLEEARKTYHRFQNLLELNFYHMFGLTDCCRT